MSSGDLASTPSSSRQSHSGSTQNAVLRSSSPVAYLDGQAIQWRDLTTALVESAGGQVLAEMTLDRKLGRKLRQLGQKIDESHLATERVLLAETLDKQDPDRAQRLLRELRQRRGLGEYRFRQLLIRNASLRLLVQDQSAVEISDAAIDQAYQYEHGPRYEARLITTESYIQAASLVRRVQAGESFVDLAVAHSTDSSRVQGGMLGPISVVDPTYPKAIRATLAALQPGDISDPIALEEGFSILRLERIVPGDGVALELVKEALENQVRRRVERMLMQRLVRTMLDDVDLTVMDPHLDKSWQLHRRLILNRERREP